MATPAIQVLPMSVGFTYDMPCGSDLSYCSLQYLDRHQAQMRPAHTHIRDGNSGATYSGGKVRGGRILTSQLRHHSSGWHTSYGSAEYQCVVSVPGHAALLLMSLPNHVPHISCHTCFRRPFATHAVLRCCAWHYSTSSIRCARHDHNVHVIQTAALSSSQYHSQVSDGGVPWHQYWK